MGETGTDCQRIIGRIFAFNPEEGKLSEGNIGLINLSEENQFDTYKLKLNMSDVKSYSIFEGEIIVAEGFVDITTPSKFNVTRIHKPQTNPPASNMSFNQVRDFN